MSINNTDALAGREPARAWVSSPTQPSFPPSSPALAIEVLESLRVGDHTFHTLPVLRAARGFQQILCAGLVREKAAARPTPPNSQIVLIAANPVAHGARLVASVRESIKSSTMSVVTDARLAEEGLEIEYSFPGISGNSLLSFVSRKRLVFAFKLRSLLPRRTSLIGSTSRLYREYLFIAQAVRYAACHAAVKQMPPTTILLTDFDRHTYCQPWVWAANGIGMTTVTLTHGSPNEANYVPVLARHSLVWGAVQKEWMEDKSPGVDVQIVGRPDLAGHRFGQSGTVPRVVLCHSRERLSIDETDSLVAHLSNLTKNGHVITLRLHPSATENDLDERWSRVASMVNDVVVSRDSFVSSLRSSDLVICIASSSAVEAIAVGVAAVVIADEARTLPGDLEAIRSASPAVLREFAAHGDVKTPHLNRLASQILAATGAPAGHLLDQALLKIRA